MEKSIESEDPITKDMCDLQRVRSYIFKNVSCVPLGFIFHSTATPPSQRLVIMLPISVHVSE